MVILSDYQSGLKYKDHYLDDNTIQEDCAALEEVCMLRVLSSLYYIFFYMSSETFSQFTIPSIYLIYSN